MDDTACRPYKMGAATLRLSKTDEIAWGICNMDETAYRLCKMDEVACKLYKMDGVACKPSRQSAWHSQSKEMALKQRQRKKCHCNDPRSQPLKSDPSIISKCIRTRVETLELLSLG